MRFVISYIAFAVNAGFSALNLGLYVQHHQWYSLSAAVFCGSIAAWTFAMEAVDRR